MKAFSAILAAITLFSSVSYANTKFVCREQGGSKMTLVLDRAGKEPLSSWGSLIDGVEYKYALQFYRGNRLHYYSKSFSGVVSAEDVNLTFTSDDNFVVLRIYLDSVEEAFIRFGDNKAKRLFCY